MTAIVSQFEELERNQGEFETASTTLINRKVTKFPAHPIAVVSPVRSVAQTSAKYLGAEAKIYFLPPNIQKLASMLLPLYPYQLRTIEEQPEELGADDIAIHTWVRPISGQNVGFVQASAGVKRGKFLTPPIAYSSTSLPRLKSKLGNFETDEEEPVWRGVFALPRSAKVLFSKEVEIKGNELPTWKPCVVIDSYRLEDDDE